MIIRGRTESDLGECVQILAEVHRLDGYPETWPADPAGWLARPGLIAAWVAAGDDGVAGHAALSWPRPGNPAAALYGDGAVLLSRLFVAPAARGLGVGARLAGHAVRQAREDGLHPVLEVLEAEGSPAIALYERLGWKLLGRTRQNWGGLDVPIRCYAAPG